MANLEKKKQNGFWQEALELTLDLFCLPFRLIAVFFRGLWWVIKGIGHGIVFIVELFIEFLGAILEAIFGGW